MVSRSKIYDYFILVYKPKHPKAFGSGYVPEHILVAEKVLGRDLTPDEDVRHINGDTHDNRPQNLEITSYNADYRTQSLTSDFVEQRAAAKTFIPCKFQKPCWKEIRAPIAKREGVFLPYLCSYQLGGDIYKCGHFWNFVDKEMNEKGEDTIDSNGDLPA